MNLFPAMDPRPGVAAWLMTKQVHAFPGVSFDAGFPTVD
jgi:hypothetical protein